MTTALSSAMRSSVASPCPTSQLTACQRSGGHPGLGGLFSEAAIRTSSNPNATTRRFMISVPNTSMATLASVTTVMDHGVAGQAISAPGRAAPTCAAQRIHCAHQPASHPVKAAAPGAMTPSPAVANPNTVAGPTAGPVMAFVASPTTLTRSEIVVTTGWVANCAASGTAHSSASQRGAHAMASTQRRANTMIPALASTDRVNPMDRLSHGSTSSSPVMATARCLSPRTVVAWEPTASRATVPIAAARRTLGSVRHRAMNTTTATAPTRSSHRPRTPHQRAPTMQNAARIDRFAPDTAVRWVRPVTMKSSRSSSVMWRRSPTTNDGTRARRSVGRSATASRNPPRTCSTARPGQPGGATTSMERRVMTARWGSPGSGARSVARARTREPTGVSNNSAASSPLTRTTTVPVTLPNPPSRVSTRCSAAVAVVSPGLVADAA